MAPLLDAFKRRRYVPRVAMNWLSRMMFVACLSVAVVARADEMDLALSRLSVGECERTLTDAEDFALERDGVSLLSPDDVAFARLVSQLSAVVAPGVLAPVTTRGPLGFDVAFDTSLTRIDSRAAYWKRGSRGRGPLTCDGRNNNVAGALASNRVRFSKGLPLGITLGANIGKVHRTGLWTFGGEIKVAIVEGANDPYTPAFAVRVASGSLVGDSALSLTAVSADALLSKEWVAADSLKIAPYVAIGTVYTRAQSSLVDLTPNIDATACSLGADAVCNRHGLAASPADFAHDRRFERASLWRARGFVGVWLRYDVFAFAVEGALDVAAPRVDGGSTARQWGVSFAPSLSF